MNKAHTLDRFPRTSAVIQRGIEARLHLGVQLYVSLDNVAIVDAAMGEAVDGVPLTSDHIMWWLSAGKPLTAVAVMQRVDRGEVSLDDAVTRFIPEFGVNDKESITIRHLLTHTAGIQPVPTGWPRNSWEESLERIVRAKIRQGGQAGATSAYDPARSWFVLGEILRRVNGRPIEQIVREDICEPLEMESTLMAFSDDDYASLSSRLAVMHSRQQEKLIATNDSSRDVLEKASPGGSLRGPIRELGTFYEMLLNGGERDGKRVFNEETVALMCRRHRKGEFDLTFQRPIDFGLGVMLNTAPASGESIPYGFGPYADRATFGHGGAECSLGFCDPAQRLVVAYASNGRPGEALHEERNWAIVSAIYEDLRLS